MSFLSFILSIVLLCSCSILLLHPLYIVAVVQVKNNNDIQEEFIREEKKFESLDALKKQIASDIAYAKKVDVKKYSKTP